MPVNQIQAIVDKQKKGGLLTLRQMVGETQWKKIQGEKALGRVVKAAVEEGKLSNITVAGETSSHSILYKIH